MKLFLHIGTGGSGTQIVQDMLKRNAELLGESGFFYPLIDKKKHHNALALPLCGSKPPRYLRTRFSKDFDKNVKSFQAYFDTLEHAIKAENPKNVVLSSEFLGRAFSVEHGKTLFSRLRALFDDITVIAFVQTPANHYLSSTLQKLRTSPRVSPPDKQKLKAIIGSYEPLGASIVLKEYDPGSSDDHQICKDLLNALDPKLSTKVTWPRRQNGRMPSAEVLSIIQDYRSETRSDATSDGDVETTELLERLMKVADRNGLMATPRLKPEIEAALNSVDEQITWLRDRHGLTFSGIDYGSNATSAKLPKAEVSRLEDVCVIDEDLRGKIQIHLLSELNRMSAQKGQKQDIQSEDKTPNTGADLPDNPPTQEEIERLKARFPVLRRPEIEHYAVPALVAKARDTGMVRIRSNFPDVALSDIESWNFNPLKHVVWRIYFNSFAWVAAIAVEDDGKTRLDADWNQIKKLIGLFLDHFEDNAENPKSDIWDDHATGYRASYLAWVYAGGLVDHLSPEEDSRLRRAMQLHRLKLMEYLDSGRWTFSNHTLFQAEGLADLAMVFLQDRDQREDVLNFAADKVSEFVQNAVTSAEGTVKEHAMFYHVFLMGRLLETCDFFGASGCRISDATDEMFTKMNQFLHDIMPVEGRLPGIGDSKHHQPFDKKYVREYGSDRFSNGRIRYHETNGQTGTRYQFMTSYPSDGYFIFRSHTPPEKQLYSVLLHRTFRGPHGHWDGASFVCYKNGSPILIDSGGPYMYSTPMRYKYFVTPLAHNSLIFDNNPVQYTTRLLDIEEGEGSGAVALGAEMGDGCYWVRVYTQDADHALLVVDIPVCRSEGHSAEARFHIDPEIAFAEGMSPELSGEWGHATLSHHSVPLAKTHVARICVNLDSGLDVAPKSDFVPPEDREKGLDADFDRRSYVTYKDNEMQDASLYCKPVPIGHATLTCLNFSAGDRGYSLACDGGTLTIGGGTLKSGLKFNVRGLLFER